MKWTSPSVKMPKDYQLVVLELSVPFSNSWYTKLVKGYWDPLMKKWIVEDYKETFKLDRVSTWRPL